ncbi:MAG: CBS domain-containing protein [Steroidobacteraceae bacterium]
MFVSMWMSKDLITTSPDVSVVELARLMRDKAIRRLPVVDQAGKLLGLVSSEEVLHAFPPDVNPFAVANGEMSSQQCGVKLTAADVMSLPEFTTEPETPIEEVARVMRDQKIGATLVMRKEMLVGIITESDVFRAFTEIFDPGTHGVRITFDNSAGEDVFPLIAELAHRHHLRVMSFVSLHMHERPLCVVQVTGPERATDAMLNDIWKSHHQVVSVIHLGADQAA